MRASSWSALLIGIATACTAPPVAPVEPATRAQLAFAVSDQADALQLPVAERVPGVRAESFEEYAAYGPRGAGVHPAHIDVVFVGDIAAQADEAFGAALAFAELFLRARIRLTRPAPLPQATGYRSTRSASTDAEIRLYATTWFLDTLLPSRALEEGRASDGVGGAALTTVPLVGEPAGRRTFGEADRAAGSAVCSLDRLHEPWTTSGELEDDESRRLTELRAMKLVVHEIAHVFGLLHCTEFRCVVNAVGTVRDLDARPLHLCPGCLRKLQWNRGFDVLARWRQLERFLRDLGHTEEARWFRRRVRRVQRSGESPPR